MKIKIEGRLVDVLGKECAHRPCFSLGFDKGAYTPGRGYTSYHTDGKGKRVERAVCGTRQFRGCPTNSVCPVCRTGDVADPGTPCDRPGCSGVRTALKDEQP